MIEDQNNQSASEGNSGFENASNPQNDTGETKSGKSKGRKKSSRSSEGQHRSKTNARQKAPWMSWEELKNRIHARLAGLDREALKKVLLVCGLGLAAVAAVLLIIKLMPVGITILALLGLGLSLQFWDRLRWFPRPF